MNALSIQIVPFVPELHQPGVSLLYDAIKDEFPENMFGNPPKTLTELSQLANRYYWITTTNERVTGTVGIIVLDNHNCGLKGMFLAKELRGTDAAKLMLQTAINAAIQKGCTTMYLGTMGQFKAAQRFYEKLGFAEITREQLPPDFPPNAVDTVFYSRSLL